MVIFSQYIKDIYLTLLQELPEVFRMLPWPLKYENQTRNKYFINDHNPVNERQHVAQTLHFLRA